MGDWKIIVSGSTKDLTSDYGFYVTDQFGTGMANVENISTNFGILDGAVFKRARADVRQFTLNGVLSASSIPALHASRASLIGALDAGSPLEMQYTGAASTLQASAYYDAGLELGTVGHNTEYPMALRFLMYNPYFEGASNSASLLGITTTSIAQTRYFTTTSGWSDTATAGVSMRNYQIGTDGNLYATSGQFIYFLTEASVGWQSVDATPFNNTIRDIALTSDGGIYVVGDFTTYNGSAFNYTAFWDGSQFWPMGIGLNDFARTVAVTSSGSVVVGGRFDAAGGAQASRLAIWDPAASIWTDAGGDFANDIFSVAVDGQDNIYVGGLFSTVRGSTERNVIQYLSPSSFSSMNGGITGLQVNNIVISKENYVYVGGQDTLLTPDSYFWRWDQSRWQSFELTNSVEKLFVTDDNTILAQLQTGSGFYKFTGTNFVRGNIILGGTRFTRGAISFDNALYMTMDVAATGASVVAFNSVTNNGTAKAYPTFTASGPATLYELSNYTTGQFIYFNALSIQSGEVVTLDLTLGTKTFTSNFSGNIISKIQPSSNLVEFTMLSGSNFIGLLMSGGSANLTWTDRYWSVDTDE